MAALTETIDGIFWCSLSQLAVIILLFRVNNINWFSLAGLFIIFATITHLGQYYSHAMDIRTNIGYYSDIFVRFSTEVVVDCGAYTISVIQMFTMGISFVYIKNSKNKINIISRNYENVSYNRVLKTIGRILIAIGVLPALYIEINKLYLFAIGGYSATYTIRFLGYGLLFEISNFWKLGVIALILANKDKQSVAKRITYISVCILLITMLSGQRISNSMYCIAIVYTFVYAVKKKDNIKVGVRKKFGLIVASYFGLVFLSIIDIYRSSSSNFIYIATRFGEDIFLSPIKYLIQGFSSTMATFCYTYVNIIDNSQYGYGFTYLISLLNAIPNIGQIQLFRGYTVYGPEIIPGFSSMWLGGSIIGEIYFNFGKYGPLFAVLIGVLVGIFSNELEKALKSNNYFKYLVFISIMPTMLAWNRAYFSEMVRPLVWSWLLLTILFSLKNTSNELLFIKNSKNNTIS